MNFLNSIKESFSNLSKTRTLTGSALLAATGIILKQASIKVNDYLVISFSFAALAISGFLYGPFAGALVGFIADLIGFILHPNGAFFIGFTIGEALAGFLYGLILYRKKVTLLRTFIACLAVALIINLGLTSVWLQIMYGNVEAYIMLRLIKNIVQLPVNTAILYGLLKVIEKFFNKSNT